jgi:hypothetical protein
MHGDPAPEIWRVGTSLWPQKGQVFFPPFRRSSLCLLLCEFQCRRCWTPRCFFNHVGYRQEVIYYCWSITLKPSLLFAPPCAQLATSARYSSHIFAPRGIVISSFDDKINVLKPGAGNPQDTGYLQSLVTPRLVLKGCHLSHIPSPGVRTTNLLVPCPRNTISRRQNGSPTTRICSWMLSWRVP